MLSERPAGKQREKRDRVIQSFMGTWFPVAHTQVTVDSIAAVATQGVNWLFGNLQIFGFNSKQVNYTAKYVYDIDICISKKGKSGNSLTALIG